MNAIVFIAGSRIFCDRKRLFTGENITFFFTKITIFYCKKLLFLFFFEDAILRNGWRKSSRMDPSSSPRISSPETRAEHEELFDDLVGRSLRTGANVAYAPGCKTDFFGKFGLR